uniref:Uncharacterized protein n=1 Tax=Anguilla anguilla TaxID=7936 RepID=A0A0E9XZJ9_ANGAN
MRTVFLKLNSCLIEQSGSSHFGSKTTHTHAFLHFYSQN